MSVLNAGIRFTQWAVLRGRVLPGDVAPTIPDPKIVEAELEDIRRLDEPPANPNPPPKPKPGDIAPAPHPGPQPQPQPQPKGPWRRDPKTCTIVRDPKATNALKTQACIAWNVCQAMTDAYNRGYATGRSNSRNHKGRCRNAELDSAWLNQRLKRIILSQDNPQTHRKRIWSRKK